MKTTVCIAEDRKVSEPGVKLLILSLNLHSPNLEINLFYPRADGAFRAWLEEFPNVCLRTAQLRQGYAWNVKPQAMLQMLQDGFDEVIWIDSDILITRNIVPIFSDLGSSTIVVAEHTLAEERDDSNARRARLWSLPVGRKFALGVSSGIVRVTGDHRRLLERWWELLQTEEYQRFQVVPWKQRPVHMLGDQDVLTALLTSTEFCDVPVHVLKRGEQIIQFDGVYGYVLSERLKNLAGNGPSFIHAGAEKPWSAQWTLPEEGRVREYVKKVYLDISPYTIAALPFKPQLDSDTEWMAPHFRLSSLLRVLGLGYAPLVGFPMAVFADVARVAKYLRKLRRPSNLSKAQTGIDCGLKRSQDGN